MYGQLYERAVWVVEASPSTTCGSGPVAPGATCQIAVKFTGNMNGSQDTLNVNAYANNSPLAVDILMVWLTYTSLGKRFHGCGHIRRLHTGCAGPSGTELRHLPAQVPDVGKATSSITVPPGPS